MAKTYDRVTVVDHPLVQHKLSILRDKNTPVAQFRQLVHELSILEGYEASRHLRLEPVDVETPIQVAHCQRLAGPDPVLVPILRAGLGMLEGMLTMLPTARVGHLGMERDEVTHLPRVYYSKMPRDLANRQIVVIDPMFATGGSAVAAIEYLRSLGAKDIALMVLVAAPEGIEAALAADPDIHIFTCAIDDGLNENAYIVPGLGDAGDRIYGTL